MSNRPRDGALVAVEGRHRALRRPSWCSWARRFVRPSTSEGAQVEARHGTAEASIELVFCLALLTTAPQR
jgi:hypothetical protein